MIKCKICGCTFNALVEKHYISRGEVPTGIAGLIGGGSEESLYDTFDCPQCGCQTIAQARKRKYTAEEGNKE